jgi:UDP-2,3-diacylglucosamine hydrolase
LEEIILQNNKKIYFASDFHLGAPNFSESLKREKTICKWLDFIKKDAQLLFLVGDLFDFWFEHKTTIPKGHTRFLGKMAELADAGIEIIIFTGNHDMWMRDYFQIEFGAKIYRNPQSYLINGQKFYVGHGDGLGPGDYPYKLLKKIFENSFCKFLFGNLLHPNLSLKLGYLWANHSWKKHDKEKDVYVFKSLKDEILFQYCLQSQTNKTYDFYVFGHRHYTFDEALIPSGRYINLGDWIKFQSFACFDGQNLKLEIWDNK